MLKKIKVAVLYGGRSAEREISQLSAASVLANLDKNKFEMIPIAIDETGRWFINNLEKCSQHNEKAPIHTQTAQEISPMALMQTPWACDVVFPVLHGKWGEDGTIQGLFEMLNLPYVGANVLASAIGMDKDIAKQLAHANQIPVVPFLVLQAGKWQRQVSHYQQKIQSDLAYPVFVKPANAGSSVGISKVNTENDLTEAIQQAFKFDTKILVEQACEVREIEVAVLENSTFAADPFVSLPGEIVPRHAFYSYDAKYNDDKGAELIIPAVLHAEQAEKIKQLAIKIFSSLACDGMARVDFFIEKSTQKIFFNEINTIPGFTKISMYPKLWEISGRSYTQLLTDLIELAFARHKRSLQLQ